MLEKKAQKNFLPMQAGDVYVTYADVDRLSRAIAFAPVTSFAEGLKKLVAWYTSHYAGTTLR